MKSLTTFIFEQLNTLDITKSFLDENKDKVAIWKPKNYGELCNIIKQCTKIDPSCSLNWIDVSDVKNMKELFYKTDRENFNGDISKWDVSKVTNMSCMFYGSKFNGDISKWDVKNVKNMCCMFRYSQFNGDISKWDTSKVTDMRGLFAESQFNGDISKWDTSKVTDMGFIFQFTKFDGDISKWDVSKVTDMNNMFRCNKFFNGDISKWNVSCVTDASGMFDNSMFDRDISKWNLDKLKHSDNMFRNCPIKEEYKPKSTGIESSEEDKLITKKLFEELVKILPKNSYDPSHKVYGPKSADFLHLNGKAIEKEIIEKLSQLSKQYSLVYKWKRDSLFVTYSNSVLKITFFDNWLIVDWKDLNVDLQNLFSDLIKTL